MPSELLMPPTPTGATPRDSILRHAQPRLGRSLLELCTSAVPYLALSVLSYQLLHTSPLLSLALVLPLTGFLLRTFIMFHDCTHGALLRSRRANAYVGAFLGLLVLAPFSRWRHDHAVHHATSGDLERRGVGDVPTLTVAEYWARPWRGRLAYRAFRHPIVMFGLGPIVAMMIGPRVPTRAQRPQMRRSVIRTDLAIALVAGGLCWWIGWSAFLLVWAPPALLAGAAGIWLFYVQHQFEDAYWQHSEGWDYADAALQGSSYLKLPRVLQFFTGNIGLHHVHHLNARIPNYNLQAAHDECDALHGVPELSLLDGVRAVRLKLWDEDSRKLVTFAQARERQGGARFASIQRPALGEPAAAEAGAREL
jgi:omega-6 fatty acid desaturase (delta-12 desaturase)